jgi:hypothetical protein
MGMVSFVIYLLVFFSYGKKILSNVSHIITMIELIRGEIFFSSLTFLKLLESPWRMRFIMEMDVSLWGVRFLMEVGILLEMVPSLSSFSIRI